MSLTSKNIIFLKTMLSVSRTNVTRVFLTLIIIILPLTISQQIYAATLKEQRQQYLDAKKGT